MGGEIPDNKRLEYALQHLHGIGRSKAHHIVCELGVENKFVKDLSKRELYSIRELLSKYLIGNDLVLSSHLLNASFCINSSMLICTKKKSRLQLTLETSEHCIFLYRIPQRCLQQPLQGTGVHAVMDFFFLNN